MRISGTFQTLFLVATISIAALFFAAPMVTALDGIEPGMEIPMLTLEDLAGRNQEFHDFKGDRVTVLVFWSTWSSNSRSVLARMNGLQERYGARGLSIVGINVENQEVSEADLENIRDMVADLKLTFPILVDRGLTAFRHFGVIAVPTTFVMDGAGMVQKLPGMPLMAFEELYDSVVAAMENEPAAEEITHTPPPNSKGRPVL